MTISRSKTVITGWDIISPIGIGISEFTEGIKSEKIGMASITESFPGDHPVAEGPIVPAFNIKEFVSKKGTRLLDRTTGLAIATIKMINNDGSYSEKDPSRTGVVLGTHGSIKSITDFIKETFIQPKPFMVNPSEFTNTVMNCAAGQCAIWHNAQGLNTTISAGRLSSLLALKYASTQLKQSNADLLYCGGVEEYCEMNAWAYYHTAPEELYQTRPFGEGCAVFALEQRDDNRECDQPKGLAEIIAVQTGLYIQDMNCSMVEKVSGIAANITKTLKIAGLKPNDIQLICKDQCSTNELNNAENQALNQLFSQNKNVEMFSISNLIGNNFCVTGAFQLAALLAKAGNKGDSKPDYALSTIVCDDGSVGSMIVKI